MKAKIIVGSVIGKPEKHGNHLENALNEWLSSANNIKEIKHVQFSDYASSGTGYCAVLVFYEELAA